jgi:hypothetical protein
MATRWKKDVLTFPLTSIGGLIAGASNMNESLDIQVKSLCQVAFQDHAIFQP